MFKVVEEGDEGILAFLRSKFMIIPMKARSHLRKVSCKLLTYQCKKPLCVQK
jgi:hypothetical protein